MRLLSLVFLIIAGLLSGLGFDLEMAWAEAACEGDVSSAEVGSFPVSPIAEASGLAVLPGEAGKPARLFVANDSGDGGRFFRSKLDGSGIEEFKIKNWRPTDLEDIDLGPCPQDLQNTAKDRRCLALADIGDNRAKRLQVEIAFVPLDSVPDTFDRKSREVEVKKTVTFQYPDRSHNAEALVVLDSRTAVVVTKEQDKVSRAAQVAHGFSVAIDQPVVAGSAIKAQKVLEFDVPTWLREFGLDGLVTGAAVAATEQGASRRRLLLLTYRDAIEVSLQISPTAPWSIESRRVFRLTPLPQQEAVAYEPGGVGFYYTTESPVVSVSSQPASIRLAAQPACSGAP